MKVGDLVRCTMGSMGCFGNCGLVMRIDRTNPTRGYQKRYWVLMHGKKSPFPFLEHQLEVI